MSCHRRLTARAPSQTSLRDNVEGFPREDPAIFIVTVVGVCANSDLALLLAFKCSLDFCLAFAAPSQDGIQTEVKKAAHPPPPSNSWTRRMPRRRPFAHLSTSARAAARFASNAVCSASAVSVARVASAFLASSSILQARARWVSMLLLEWLRNAVQPPGSRTHSFWARTCCSSSSTSSSPF